METENRAGDVAAEATRRSFPPRVCYQDSGTQERISDVTRCCDARCDVFVNTDFPNCQPATSGLLQTDYVDFFTVSGAVQLRESPPPVPPPSRGQWFPSSKRSLERGTVARSTAALDQDQRQPWPWAPGRTRGSEEPQRRLQGGSPSAKLRLAIQPFAQSCSSTLARRSAPWSQTVSRRSVSTNRPPRSIIQRHSSWV